MRTLALILLILALPATAVADQDVSGTPEVARLTGVAERYWHAAPACASYAVLVGPLVLQGVAGEATIPGCWMRFDPTSWAEPGALGEFDRCTVFVHEWGHSLGYEHTTDPNSVMDPATIYTTGAPPECKTILAEGQLAEHLAIKATVEAELAHEEVLEHEASVKAARAIKRARWHHWCHRHHGQCHAQWSSVG